MVISNSKKANLSASRKQRIKLQLNGEKNLTFSEFLKHRSGMEVVINAKALQSYQLVEDSDNTYRCTLPKVQLMSFEVFPVKDEQSTEKMEKQPTPLRPAEKQLNSLWFWIQLKSFYGKMKVVTRSVLISKSLLIRHRTLHKEDVV